ALHRRRRARTIGTKRWRTHHHCARGLTMLRGFLVIFLLCTIAIIAVFGFRGQTSTGPPLELFPDMVRQMKVRAQTPLNLFADGLGPRLPVVGTMPIGYEMPKPEAVATTDFAAVGPYSHPHAAFSAGTDY